MICVLCNGEHSASKCPTLSDDLKQGFYAGKHDPSENDEDSIAKLNEKLCMSCDDHEILCDFHSHADTFFPYSSFFRTHLCNTLSAEHNHYMLEV